MSLEWRERLAMQSVRSLFSKEVLDVITTSTADLGPLSLDSFKKNSLSAPWQGSGVDTSFRTSENQTTLDVKSSIMNAKRDSTSKDDSHQKVDSKHKQSRKSVAGF